MSTGFLGSQEGGAERGKDEEGYEGELHGVDPDEVARSPADLRRSVITWDRNRTPMAVKKSLTKIHRVGKCPDLGRASPNRPG